MARSPAPVPVALARWDDPAPASRWDGPVFAFSYPSIRCQLIWEGDVVPRMDWQPPTPAMLARLQAVQDAAASPPRSLDNWPAPSPTTRGPAP